MLVEELASKRPWHRQNHQHRVHVGAAQGDARLVRVEHHWQHTHILPVHALHKPLQRQYESLVLLKVLIQWC